MSNIDNDSARTGAVKSPPGIISRIRTYFLTGLVVAGPVAVTLWLVWWFVTWVDGLVRPFFPVAYRPETYLPVHIPGLGLIIAFVALTLLGFFAANLIGRKLVDFGESILSHMPIVRPIYRTAKQIFQTLFSKSESSFRRVGLIEFPSPGMWSLVFLTQSPTEQIRSEGHGLLIRFQRFLKAVEVAEFLRQPQMDQGIPGIGLCHALQLGDGFLYPPTANQYAPLRPSDI